MKIAVTGGTGFVGRFVVEEALAAGDTVVVLTRRPPNFCFSNPVQFMRYELGANVTDQLSGVDAVVHAAFDHVPFTYRGGEGNDPEGFLLRNLDGTIKLINAARAAGVSRFVFLSSRAIYGDYPPGTTFYETTALRPGSLYGCLKRDAEAALYDSPIVGVSLRVTGVYGPVATKRSHKWRDLFARYAAGDEVAPRIGSEVHGEDVAAAVRIVLTMKDGRDLPRALNVSDILLDRRKLLETYSRVTGVGGRLPPRASTETFNQMSSDLLRSLGWRPFGMSMLAPTVRALVEFDASA